MCFFFIILRNLTSTFYIKPTCTEIKSVRKKKTVSVDSPFLVNQTTLFGQFLPFQVLSPSLTALRVLEGVVNSPAFLALYNLNRLVLKPLVLVHLPLRAPQRKKSIN